MKTTALSAFGLVFALHLIPFAQAQVVSKPDRVVTQSQNGNRLAWRSDFTHAGATLRIMAPNGAVTERTFASDAVQLDINPQQLAEGTYVYEITMVSQVAAPNTPRSQAVTPQFARSTGSFLVRGGSVYSANDGLVESTSKAKSASTEKASPGIRKDQVIPDDLIVQGSICVGFDCVNNESFGFDTVRLKENNLRIAFSDTSTGSFPANQWELTANDSASGGLSRLSIRDVTASRDPFTVVAGAPSDSIRISSTGQVGFRTAVPMKDAHFTTGDSPTIRFEQNNSSGFSPQTWDAAGNEANFFVRDVSNGNLLPFRIRPGAPTSSLDIAAGGNVGVGTASPAQSLHVRRENGSARVFVEEASTTTAARTLANFTNNGAVTVSYTTTEAAPVTWETTAAAAQYQINVAGSGTPQLTLAANGNLNISGSLTQASSITLKENLAKVSSEELLKAVQNLPLYTWNYLAAKDKEKHLGPTAEDFHRTFKLGNNPKAIAPGDMAGVALGAIQALSSALAERDRELAALRERMSALEALVTGVRR